MSLTYAHRMPLPPIDCLVLDTETTGFVPRVHRVIEIACVKVEGGQRGTVFEQLFSVPVLIPPHVKALTSIQDEDLVGKPIFSDILGQLQELAPAGTIIVGQNIAFDIGMLKGEGFDLTDYPRIDTAMLASIVFPELSSYSLGYVSQVLSLDHEPQHRALGDVYATLGLLERCWERLLLLPSRERSAILSLAARGPDGYRRLFETLPSSKKRSRPSWLERARAQKSVASHAPSRALSPSKNSNVLLLEDTLSQESISAVMSTVQAGSERTLCAVKNLDSLLSRGLLPTDARVIFSPDAMLNPQAASAILSKETLTNDELTLAIKLALYQPILKRDLPIHGEEYAIWAGSLACTEADPVYREQFKDLPSLIIADHRHALALIASSDPLLAEGTNVIIDDASSLEDAATHAYGYSVSIDHLRAGAQSNDSLTKALDLLELWMEKTRSGSDVRHLVSADLTSADAEGVTHRMKKLLSESALPSRTTAMLRDIVFILDPDNLAGRFAWIEQFQDGKKFIKSVPADIARTLGERLYRYHPTSLIIPPLPRSAFAAILPPQQTVDTVRLADVLPSLERTFPVEFANDTLLDPVFSMTGKAVLLLQSKRMIEEVFVKYVDILRQRGITLLCQGMSGGQSRMQAEFAASKEPTIIVTTPWSYEGYDLPSASVCLLALHCLPFDHPSQAVFSRRAERYNDPFKEYSLPRLKHRLFRILKTFARHATPQASVRIADDRLKTKGYGPEVRAFLSSILSEDSGEQEVQMRLL